MPTQITDIKDILGKTIANIAHDTVEGNFGPEPITYLIFTDGTSFGFVQPNEE